VKPNLGNHNGPNLLQVFLNKDISDTFSNLPNPDHARKNTTQDISTILPEKRAAFSPVIQRRNLKLEMKMDSPNINNCAIRVKKNVGFPLKKKALSDITKKNVRDYFNLDATAPELPKIEHKMKKGFEWFISRQR
jgi:hypothetical protein